MNGGSHSRSVATQSEPQMKGDAGLFGSSAIMAAGTVVSRLTGFGRAAVIAAALSLTGLAADAFNIPNVLPNMLYILVGGGVLNSVLVPALVRAIKNDADGGEAYSQRLFSVTVAVLGFATVIAVLAAPLIMRAVVSDRFLLPDNQALFDNTVMFARFCLPQIFFYGLYVLIGQMLNARGRFGPMMWSPILNNVIAIAIFGSYLVVYGQKAPNEAFTNTEVTILGVGSTLGVAAQAIVLLPVLRNTGFSLRFRIDWRGHGLGEAIRLGMWTFGFVAVNQLAYLIVVKIASGAAGNDGAGYTVYANAMLMMMVPHSIITVSLATALLPRLADLASDNDLEGVRERLISATRTCLAVIIPIAAVLAALAFPLAALIFDYGAAAGQTGPLALTLICLMPGLVAFTIHYLVLRGFYAVQDTKTPFYTQIWISAVMIISTVTVAIVDPDRAMVVPLIAAGYSISYVVGSTVGVLRLQGRLGSLEIGRLFQHILRVAVPAVIAAGLAWLIWTGWSQLNLLGGLPKTIARIIELGLGGTIGVATFIGLAYAIRIEEVRTVVDLIVARLTGRAPAAAVQPDAGDLMEDTAEHLLPVETGTLSLFRRPLDPEMTSEFVLDDTMHGIPSLWESSSLSAVESRTRHLDIDTQPDLPVVGSSRPPVGTPMNAAMPPAAAAAPASGTEARGQVLIGRYRLDRLLDDSSGVKAWQAVDDVLRRNVFVSTIPLDDPRADDFAAAARAAATIADPRFLRVLDVGTDHEVYVVREWTHGHSLAQLLAGGPLQSDQAAAIARETADALSYAHAQGLAHRRIDPTVVFVTTEGSVKIAGLETEAALHGATELGDNPARPITEPALVDTAGIGGILYAGLTARWPWEPVGGLPAAPRVDGRIPSPRQVRPGVPRDLNVIADRAIGHASRHHATPLLGPAAVASELLNSPSGQARLGGYDAPAPASAMAAAANPQVAAAPPRLAPRDEPPPLPGRRRERRSGGLLRVVGIVGASLLLIGATLVGLQMLLSSIGDDSIDPPSANDPGNNEPPPDTPPEPVEIVGATEFDPLGDDQHPEDAGNVIDGDTSTTWETLDYFTPMEDQKDGLGLYLDLGKTVDIRQLNLTLFGAEFDTADLEIRVPRDNDVLSDLDDWQRVATIKKAGTEVEHTFDEPLSAQYVLVWFTRLPQIDDGGDWRGGIAEAEVLG